MPCVENSLHGGRRSRSEQDGGVSLVADRRAAGVVKFAEREQPLRIACRSRGAQMPKGSHVVAGDVPRDQTESEMSRCIASRGHGGEMGARAFVAPGRGALQPLERFGPVVSRPGLIEVREGQQVLGRRMTLDRHVEQNRPALHARVGRCREPVGHGCAPFDVRRSGRRRRVRFRRGAERNEQKRRDREQAGKPERARGHGRSVPPGAAPPEIAAASPRSGRRGRAVKAPRPSRPRGAAGRG